MSYAKQSTVRVYTFKVNGKSGDAILSAEVGLHEAVLHQNGTADLMDLATLHFTTMITDPMTPTVGRGSEGYAPEGAVTYGGWGPAGVTMKSGLHSFAMDSAAVNRMLKAMDANMKKIWRLHPGEQVCILALHVTALSMSYRQAHEMGTSYVILPSDTIHWPEWAA